MKKINTERGYLFEREGINAFILAGSKYESKLTDIADYLHSAVEQNSQKFSEDYQKAENKRSVDAIHSLMRLAYQNMRDDYKEYNTRLANIAAPSPLDDPAWETEFRFYL